MSAPSPVEPVVRSPCLTRQLAGLAAFVVVCFAAAAVGGALTASSVGDWYRTLAKPSWNPPDWLFGPVWSGLYLLMAVSAWLVWRRGGWRASRGAFALFALQLALNVGWSAVFFGLRRPGLAVLEVLLLWLTILATIIAFWPKSRPAVLLLLPYLAWTSFAALLNWTIWRMNS